MTQSVEQAAIAKGWQVERCAVFGAGTDNSFSITLCKIPGHHPYVTHYFNYQDGGFYYGNYYENFGDAVKDFSRRSQLANVPTP